MRWWDTDSTIVVAQCHNPDYSESLLWLVPVDGAAPTALTAPSGEQDTIEGAVNAWQLPAGTFVQALGACGHAFLAKLDGVGGTLSPVSVPNVDSHKSVVVLGTNGDNLMLQATVSCGTGEALLDYNPAAGTSTVLLGPSVNGGGVIEAVAYPGRL